MTYGIKVLSVLFPTHLVFPIPISKKKVMPEILKHSQAEKSSRPISWAVVMITECKGFSDAISAVL